MPITKVVIKPGCISCGLCESLAPAIFKITDISHVKPTASFVQHETAIKQAARQCPVNVITYKEENNDIR